MIAATIIGAACIAIGVWLARPMRVRQIEGHDLITVLKVRR